RPTVVSWLVELDGVTVRILDEDLPAARPDLDLVPEVRSRLLQRSNGRVEAVDVEYDPIPPPWLLRASVGHRPRTRGGRTAQDQVDVTPRYDGEPGPGAYLQPETEMLGVERHGAIHVRGLVANDGRARRKGRRPRVGWMRHTEKTSSASPA